MGLSQEAASKIRNIIDNACADPNTGVPGTTVVVVDDDGELFAHSAGKRGLAVEELMTLDNIFFIASCTKLLTGIACMQLVEQGKLKLDDGEHLENILTELKGLKVLKEDRTYEEKKNVITLRQLLTHTSGFGYTFFNERLRDWSFPIGVFEASGRIEDLMTPLMFQPGEGWEYGIGIDWAGIAVERVTGMTLNDYFHRNLFEPLGIKNMSMIPTKEMRSNLAYMHARGPDGRLQTIDHVHRLPLTIDLDNETEVASIKNSGGGGMFAKPQEYTKVLTALLNDGKSPQTGKQILRKETIDEMFRNSIEKFPNFGRQYIPAAKPNLVHSFTDLYPVKDDPPQGWGLTFMLSNGGPTGRSKSTAHWAGICNLWWWADRENKVAGMVCTQILPFGDAKVRNLWHEVETEVYKALPADGGAAGTKVEIGVLGAIAL